MELYQTTFNSILNYNKFNNLNSIADISNIIIQSLKDIIKFDYSWATDLSIEIIKNKKELNKDQFHYFLSNQYIKYFTKILDNSIYNYINNYIYNKLYICNQSDVRNYTNQSDVWNYTNQISSDYNNRPEQWKSIFNKRARIRESKLYKTNFLYNIDYYKNHPDFNNTEDLPKMYEFCLLIENKYTNIEDNTIKYIYFKSLSFSKFDNKDFIEGIKEFENSYYTVQKYINKLNEILDSKEKYKMFLYNIENILKYDDLDII